ncbi:MAG: tRNA (adenosine(37)-N6)-dimethylallyltransferase MiaA [Alphaproteobacteria bacterium]|nr:tRNA (adenosine(37)-N6)-dimethylallyltransferase MiaA [Alphaproteobacteria bacterium]
MPTTVHVIAGPTGAGKSALALRMASEVGGVIINADALQIYAALPVLTAQPTPEDLAAAPHALYGVLDPAGPPCSAGHWREMALASIAWALAAGAVPIVVGGSGLYLKALMEGLAPIPDIPEAVRACAAAERTRLGPEAFFAEVRRRDPTLAARLHAGHKARVLRAWEVHEATGRPLSVWQTEPPEGPPPHWHFAVTVLAPPRPELYARCDARLLVMLEAGGWAEAARFEADVAAGRLPEGPPSARALGLAPLRAHIRGELGQPEAVARAQADTRHYAKRQGTWLRTQLRPGPRIALKKPPPGTPGGGL